MSVSLAFERLTDRAARVIERAQQEAAAIRHTFGPGALQQTRAGCRLTSRAFAPNQRG